MANPEIALKVMVQVQNGRSLDGVRRQIEQTSDAAARAQKKSSGLFDAVNKAQQGLDGVFRAGFRLQILGSQITSAGQAMLAPIQDALDTFKDFEFMTNRAAGALGFFNGAARDGSVTTIQMQDAINKAARELKLFPATDVAEGLYFWASATGETIDSQNTLQGLMKRFVPVMQAAALTQTDYEVATKGVLSILQQFDMELSGTEKGIANVNMVTNALYGYTKATALEFINVIEAFKYAGTAAHNLSIPFGDVADALGALGNLGLRGGIAGRGLAQFFNKLANPSKQARKELDKLFKTVYGGNKTFSKMIFPNGKFVGLKDSVKILAYAFKDLNEEETQRIVNMTFTQNAARALFPLLNKQKQIMEASKKPVLEYASAIDLLSGVSDDAKNSLQRDFALLADTWKGVTEGLARIYETLQTTIARAAAKVLTPILQKFGEILIVVNDFLSKNPQFVEFAATLGVILVALGGIVTAIGTFLGLAAAVVFIFNLITAPAVISAVLGAAAAFAVLAGVALLVGSSFLDAGQAAGTTIQNLIAGVAITISNVIQSLTEAIPQIADTFIQWGDQFVIWLIQAAPRLSDTLAGALQMILSKLAGFLGELIPALARMGKKFVDWIIEAAPSMLAALLNFLGSMLNWIGDHADEIGAKLLEWALAFIVWVIEVTPKVIAKVTELVGMLVHWLATDGIAALVKILTGLGQAFIDWVPKAVPKLLEAIGAAFGSLMKWFLTDGIKTITQIGVDIVKGLWNGIASMFGWIIDKVADFIKSVIPDPIKDFLGIKSPSRLMAGIGTNIVEGLAIGIARNDSALVAMRDYSSALADVASGATGIMGSAGSGGITVTTDATRTINLKVEVTSPDGAVDALTASQIAGALQSGALVRSLEQMAAVG